MMRFPSFVCRYSFFVVCIVLFSNSNAYCQDQPNILFIFADDYAYDCVGFHGNNEVATPTLDDLAQRGTVFTHAYNMGAWNGAVCLASRAMLNTGRFLWRANAADAKLRTEFAPNGKMWSQLMSSAGYETYFSGKWHVKVDPKNVFDNVEHVRAGMPKQTKAGYNRPTGPDDKNWLPWDKERGGFWQGGKHWSEVVADDAENFLAQAKDSDKPFFMYLAFNAVHDPRQAPKEFVDKYPLENISLPKPFLEEYPWQIGCNRIRDEILAPFPRTEHNVKVNRQEYYAIIAHMDIQIRRILDALKRTGMADNTYIFFTADHGLAVGHHGLMGKQNMYDHSVRVPFLVVGPDVPRARLNQRIYLQDVMASTLELAGIEKPDYVEFKSVFPLIRGEKNASYESIYGAYTSHQRMITHGQHKLIVYPKIGKRRLFDLANDPLELNDLADSKHHKNTINDLTSRLMKLQQEMDDTVSIAETANPPLRK